MFYELLGVSLFKYITVRCFCAIYTSFLIGLVLGPYMIAFLEKRQNGGQPIRSYGPDHTGKQGTPTMGGVLILLSCTVSTLLWCDLHNIFVWIILFILVSYGTIGGIDDYLKVSKRNSRGISAKLKFTLQCIFSGIATFLALYFTETGSALNFPFFKTWIFDLGAFYIFFAMFVTVGSSNAVNLTDGLDGLAIVPVMIAAVCLGFIAYLTGHMSFAKYLYIPSIQGTGELAIFCASLAGSGLGFLWYNAPPARIFMGDVGSLSIGGALGMISVLTKHEFVFAIIGGIFVLETISVILQVSYFKLTKGKRIFLMTPVHHHFEKKGWSEPTVVIRFWIISVIFAILGLATLKLR
jgi:phospho-N-acetylmuramoyl-pentapeptide-transferase